jgi:hypothetical protein
VVWRLHCVRPITREENLVEEEKGVEGGA